MVVFLWTWAYVYFLLPFPQARLSYIRVKYLFLTWLAVFVGSWVVYVQYSTYTELCRGRECKSIICEKYSKGVIDGSACSSLCEESSLYFGRCLSTKPNNQVYTGSWGDHDNVIKCQLSDILHYELGEELETKKEVALFDKPTRGTSVEKFKEMVASHLKVCKQRTSTRGGHCKSTGPQVHLKSVHSYYLGLLRICSELINPFGLEYVLYNSADLGLLELIEDIFHGTFGSFLMCDMRASTFGYTDRHDLRLVDGRRVVAEEAFKQAMILQHCEDDEDCVYGVDCRTLCNRAEHRCTAEVAQPNLARACGALKDYLLRGAPVHLQEELEKQLYACMALKGSAEQMEMEHSLILNNLKTLLWKQISHTNDS
uniref:Divergent protein kinase domain 1Aa n=1 Tax=Sinocyclocheilus rhinocerous TaxID=307959 RepID=A0A673JK24_9TELE